jgi:hypothetical protein
MKSLLTLLVLKIIASFGFVVLVGYQRLLNLLLCEEIFEFYHQLL